MLLPLRWTVDGRPETAPITAGRHKFAYELYPAPVTITQGEPCLPRNASPIPRPPHSPSRLRVSIWDTAYGETWRGGREEYTQVAYSLVEMHRAVLIAGLKPCPEPPG